MYGYVRFLIIMLGLVIIVGALIQLRSPGRRRRPEGGEHEVATQLVRDVVITVAIGVGLAVAGAVLHPVRWWHHPASTELRVWLYADRSAPVLIGCLAYLVIVIQTNRVLISMPKFRLIQARREELRCFLSSVEDEKRRKSLEVVLDHALAAAGVRVFSVPVSMPLQSVARATRMMNAAEKQILLHLKDAELDLFARQVATSLSRFDDGLKQSGVLMAALNNKIVYERDQHHESVEPDRQIKEVCSTSLSMLNDRRDRHPLREAQEVGIALWLTLVEMAGLWLFSLQFGRIEPMLLGALGGLLGSLAAVLVGNKSLALTMIVLSPVAGALNAVGGLLLVNFLARADIQVLGSVFRNVWLLPSNEISLTVALLLGVSGGLFTKLVSAGLTPLAAALTPKADQPASDLSSSPGVVDPEGALNAPGTSPEPSTITRSVTAHSVTTQSVTPSVVATYSWLSRVRRAAARS